MAKNTVKLGRLYIEKYRHKKDFNVAFVESIMEDHVVYWILGSEKTHFTSLEWFEHYWIRYDKV